MANQEAFTLDGLALNDEIAFGLDSAQLPVPRQRQDWIGAADSESQALVRNPLHDNRKITLKLGVIPQASTDIAHDKILLVLDKLQKASKYADGIPLTWAPADGTRSCTFDVLAGEITDLPIDWENGWLAKAPSLTVELTCKPYWRGTEVVTGTSAGIAVFVQMEVANVTGDVPALGRLIITDTASQSRRHVEWGLEGPLTYNASTVLLLDSDSLVTSGFAGSQASGSGYDPNASGNNMISTPVYASTVACCGTGNQSHVGTFRVKARVFPVSTNIRARFSWQANDGPFSVNAWAAPLVAGAWQELDLGTIYIPATLAGAQRWQGRIEAYETPTGATLYVDYLVLVPTADGYGKARAQYSYRPGVIAGYDNFISTTATSALGTRTAPAGGNWATSGDTTDFVFADNFNAQVSDGVESIQRSTSVTETNGRFAILGSTNYTDVQVDVRARIGSFTANMEQSVIARWTDSSNYLRLVVPFANIPTNDVRIELVVAGVVTVLAQAANPRIQQTSYRFRLIAYASGLVIGQVLSDSGSLLVGIQASSTVLATAGTLATGKPGLRDRGVVAAGGNRYFTEFAVSAPTVEPIALYSGRNMQIRHDDVFRQDSSGTYAGRPPSYRGSRFLVPVGTSRVLVKARRNDIEAAADDNVTDSTQIQVGWTPRGLAVPR